MGLFACLRRIPNARRRRQADQRYRPRQFPPRVRSLLRIVQLLARSSRCVQVQGSYGCGQKVSDSGPVTVFLLQVDKGRREKKKACEE